MRDERNHSVAGSFTSEQPEPYVRFLFRLWNRTRRELSLEEEGLLIRISSDIFEYGKPVPKDAGKAASALGVNLNKYRKVLAQLLAKGELTETADGIVSARAMAEFKRARDLRNTNSRNAKKTPHPGSNPPNRYPSNPPSDLPSNYPSDPPSEIGACVDIAPNSKATAPAIREEEKKKENGKEDRESSVATREASASQSSATGLFSLDEQGAGVIRNGSAFKWLDPKSGEPRKLTFQFIERLAPSEPRAILLDFAETELIAAVDSGKEGGLHGLLRHAIDKGRLASFKRRRRAPAMALEDFEPEAPPPITEGSWD